MPVILQCFLGSAVQEFIHSTMTWRFISKQLKKDFSTTKQRTLSKETTISKPHQKTMSGNNLNHFLWASCSEETHLECVGVLVFLTMPGQYQQTTPQYQTNNLLPRLPTKKTGYRQYTENDLMTLNNTTNNEGSKAFNPGVFSLLLSASAVSRNESCTGQLPKCFQLQEPE